MSRYPRAIISTSALVFAAGCASVIGFEELDFTNDAVTDGGREGSTEIDARVDGPFDGPPAVDAARDRATPFGCEAGTFDFCEDFEQPVGFGDAGWTEALQTYPGSVNRQNGELLAEVIDDDAGTSGFQGLKLVRPYEKKGSGERKNLAVKWRVFVEDCPPDAPILRVDVAPGNARFYMDVTIGELDGVCAAKVTELHFFPDGGYGFTNQLRMPASAGEWHDFAFDLAQAQDGLATISLRVDDRPPSTVVFKTESDRDAFGAFFGLAPGFRQAGRVRIDDIRIDYTK